MRNVRYWMMWLTSNYQRNGYCGYQATWLLENREIWCLPLNNADGWVYNETQSPGGGGMHRKNMNWSAGGTGVDLNRNWSVAWGGAGSSGSPTSETYRGTGPSPNPSRPTSTPSGSSAPRPRCTPPTHTATPLSTPGDGPTIPPPMRLSTIPRVR